IDCAVDGMVDDGYWFCDLPSRIIFVSRFVVLIDRIIHSRKGPAGVPVLIRYCVEYMAIRRGARSTARINETSLSSVVVFCFKLLFIVCQFS
ncbi:hypothetical protein PMAYCL1PPCAC_27608, partial [Pristionchus mayeri]